MNGSIGYSVYFFTNALETLGDAIKPYLQDGPAGAHVPCREVDTAGSFVELTLEGSTSDGRVVEVELMVPGNMVRMIVSRRSDEEFGFQLRRKPAPPMVALQPPMAEAEPAAPAVAISAAEPAAQAAGTTSPAA